MAVPSAKYTPSNQNDFRGLLTVMDQIAVGDAGSTKTASATSGAATLNSPSGVITSEALTTAAAATYTLTLTNTCIAAADIVLVTMGNGTNSAGAPVVTTVTPAAGSVVVVVKNVHVSAALNGTLTFAYAIVKV